MRRAKGLVEISRRDFCAFAAAGILTACTDGEQGAIQTGPLGSSGPGPDGSVPPTDGSMSGNPDASSGVACTGSPVDVGSPGSFILSKPVYFSTNKFFVVRDSGGLYAVTAVCTHEGATCVVSGSDFYCPRHGATFTFNGSIVSGPVITGLKHYAMCNMSNGHVGVIATQVVSQSQRLNA